MGLALTESHLPRDHTTTYNTCWSSLCKYVLPGILGGQIEEKLLLKPLTALLMDGKNEGVYYEGTHTACLGF